MAMAVSVLTATVVGGHTEGLRVIDL